MLGLCLAWTHTSLMQLFLTAGFLCASALLCPETSFLVIVHHLCWLLRSPISRLQHSGCFLENTARSQMGPEADEAGGYHSPLPNGDCILDKIKVWGKLWHESLRIIPSEGSEQWHLMTGFYVSLYTCWIPISFVLFSRLRFLKSWSLTFSSFSQEKGQRWAGSYRRKP